MGEQFHVRCRLQRDIVSDRYIKILFLGVLTLPGCAALDLRLPGAPEEPQIVREVSREDAARLEEIGRLLTEAELAFADDRLTTPIDDNAYLRYLGVLFIDPENAAARQGIASIVEKYLTWALDAAESGNQRRARRFLTSASAVDERHPGIESIGARIEELENASQDRHVLSSREVSARSDTAIEELKRLARLADERDALVIISARNDAEGRWIYQQMNEATPLRIRARLELAGRPMIRMLY